MMSSYRDLFSQACKQGLPPHEVQLLLEHLTALTRCNICWGNGNFSVFPSLSEKGC